MVLLRALLPSPLPSPDTMPKHFLSRLLKGHSVGRLTLPADGLTYAKIPPKSIFQHMAVVLAVWLMMTYNNPLLAIIFQGKKAARDERGALLLLDFQSSFA